MNKLFTKIGVAVAGIAMAVGVGVAVGNGEAKSLRINAATGTFNKYSGDLSAGYYVIIDLDGYALSNTKTSSPRINCESVTPSAGAITNPSDSIVWKIEANGDYWTFYNETAEVYAAFTGTNGRGDLIASVTDYAKWSPEEDQNTSGNYEFSNVGKTGKYLRYNPTYGYASYATTTGKALNLYKKASGPASLGAPTGLTYNSSTQRVTWNAVTGASGYQYTIDAGSNWTAVTSASDRYLSVDGWENGVYTIKIRATGNGTDYVSEGTASSDYEFTKVATPIYTGVTVTAGSLSEDKTKGSAYIQCSHSVQGTNVSQDVTWSITSTNEFGTGTEVAGKATIDQTGKVTFLDNVNSLYVWALAADGSTKGSVTVSASGLVDPKGTQENPYTVSEAWTIIDGLDAAGGNTDSVFYVSGTISSDPSINSYSGADFDITDGEKTLVVYSVSGARITESGSGIYIENGYSVLVSGALIKYVKNQTTKYEVGYKSAQLPGTLVSAQAPTYNVTYNSNGATDGTVPTDNTDYSKYSSVTVTTNSGSLVKTGYTFVGWNTKNDGTGTHYDADGTKTFTITADTTLYAEWEILCTVSFNSNGGSGNMANVPNQHGKYTLPANGFTAPNSKFFAGWKANNAGDMLDVGDEYTLTASTVTFYAQWGDLYTVTYHGNGAIGSMDADQKASGATVTIADNGFTVPSGKTFIGWNTQADGKGTDYTVGQQFAISDNIDLYAQWANLVTLSYNANGGSGSTASSEYQEGTTATVAANGFIAPSSDLKFKEWNTQADGNGTSYAPAATFTINADTELFAIWEEKPKTVSIAVPSDIAANDNLVAETNGAAKFGLDATKWSVLSITHSASTHVGLNKTTMTVRLYSKKNTSDGGEMIIKSLDDVVYIKSIELKYNSSSQLKSSDDPLTVKALDSSGNVVSTVSGANDKYDINNVSVSIQNTYSQGSSAQQVWFDSIEIEWDYSDDFYEVKDFEDEYVKHSVSYSDNTSGTNCLTWFDEAVTYFNSNSLTDAQRKLFATRDEFADARARLVAWADANSHKTISYDNTTGKINVNAAQEAFKNIEIESIGSTSAIIAIVSVVGVASVGGFFFIRKKKII